ncbi:MAG: hypothetical protein JJE13_00255 [Thermoleophilia bacterium]|nr:hypothetical protein [Thermoleophilia bacterium]
MTTRRSSLALFAILLLAGAAVASASTISRGATTSKATGKPGPGTKLAGCPVLPRSNAFNRDISDAPVHPRSSQYISSIGPGTNLHADFGSGQYGNYGIPFRVVGKKQKKFPVRFTAYGSESDRGPYPIPLDTRIEGGSDNHVIALQRGSCKLYELYRAQRGKGRWLADSGARFDLRSNKLRPAGWTSADAAGLPIMPGLARADEASSGRITHVLRVTVSESQRGYIHPARHFASSSNDRSLPPMGLRLRLKAGYRLGRFSGQTLAIMKALKIYGLIVADNGSDWYISGTPDRRWNDDVLDQLKTVPGRAFEAVQTGGIHR